MEIRIELFVFPLTQVITATKSVADTHNHIPITQFKEFGAGHVLVQRYAGEAMREQVPNVLPLATECRRLYDPWMLAAENSVVGIVFYPSEWVP